MDELRLAFLLGDVIPVVKDTGGHHAAVGLNQTVELIGAVHQELQNAPGEAAAEAGHPRFGGAAVNAVRRSHAHGQDVRRIEDLLGDMTADYAQRLFPLCTPSPCCLCRNI